MEKIFLFIILLILIPLVNPAKIDVSVPQVLEGELSGVFFNKTYNSGVIKTKLEFYNTGSVAFKTRIRMETFHQKTVFSTVWSDEKEMNPSEKEVFEVFSYINETGFFNSKIRVYYGGEILDYGNISFEVKANKNTKDIFEINRIRASEDYIKLDVKSKEDVDNIVILFSNYPSSWIVEQKKISGLKKNNWAPTKIKYIPISSVEKGVFIHIITEDGNFYKTEKIVLKKENTIEKIINDIIDIFKKTF